MKKLPYTLVFLIPFISFSQFSEEEQRQIDSLNRIIQDKASHDTSIAISYLALCEIVYIINIDTLNILSLKAKEIAERGLSGKTSNIESRTFKVLLSRALNNIGIFYEHQGDIPKALEHYHNSLKIDEKIENKSGIASTSTNIGLVYFYQGETSKALECFNRSLSVFEELGDRQGIASALSSIGLVYDRMKDYSQALKYYNKGLEIREELGNKADIAHSINAIGGVYNIQGDLEKSLDYATRSLQIKEELGDKKEIAISQCNVGVLKYRMGLLSDAEEHFQIGMKLATEIGSPDRISNAAALLSRVNKERGHYKEALEMYEVHIQMRDSIKNEETQKATIRQQTKYEYEKAQLIKEQKAIEAARVMEEHTRRRNNMQYSLIFLGILLFFGIVLSLGFIKVSPTIAEGLIFFAFLILFEFLLVLTDPFVDGITNGEPIYKLLANALLAGLIFPAHAFFESMLKKRLVKPKA